jgi:D-inositol-3-phosphate glycosyltransferase
MSDAFHVLLVGDFVRPSGFQRVNEAIAAGLASRSWRVSVLAVNYSGDPTPLTERYRLYPAAANGSDPLGVARLPHVLAHTKPDVVLLVNDPWILPNYCAVLPEECPPVVAYTPVDAPGINPVMLEGLGRLTHLVAYTAFGAQELLAAGVPGPIGVIPHGIDREIFAPMDQALARATLGVPADGFYVLVADQNQPRKRFDLAIAAFARFAAQVPDAYLLLHTQPVSEWGWDLRHLCYRAGVDHRTIFTRKGGMLPDELLRVVYACADVRLGAAVEGWGLGLIEAMACGIPVVAPDWSAVGEWARDAAYLVPCDDELTHTNAGGHNTIAGLARPSLLAAAVLDLYRDRTLYDSYRQRGLTLVQHPAYDWSNIAMQWDATLRQVLATPQGARLEVPDQNLVTV